MSSSRVLAISPMHPTLVREPFHRDGWIYEEKYDGWRLLAYKDGDRVRLVSRNGRDHTSRFADIAGAVAKLPARTLILDGEVCAFDANLVSHIYLLEASPDEPATPPVLMAFDCLFQRGRDLRDRSLAYRREALEDAVNGSRLIYAARRLRPHGLDAWAEVKQRGYEGLVAKRASSAYRAGSTREWLKVKVRYEGRFIVVGLDMPPNGIQRAAACCAGRQKADLRRPRRVGRQPSPGGRAPREAPCAVHGCVRRRRSHARCHVGRAADDRRGLVQRDDAWTTARSCSAAARYKPTDWCTIVPGLYASTVHLLVYRLHRDKRGAIHRPTTSHRRSRMKRYFASIAVVSLAALVVVAGAALAQTTTNPTGGVSGAGSVTAGGSTSGSGSVKTDTTTRSPSASPSMGDDKMKQDDKDRDQMKKQEQSDKKTGLDRADEAAGSHGAQGRDNARTRGNR